ncbi:hypothetical protein [Pendulispora albinea]|uniref:Tryptophan synthase alpha chain n=1 Tax=Pendulispora albinea TaxID=2741071 RepID=A0ABZ2M425_9BACT
MRRSVLAFLGLVLGIGCNIVLGNERGDALGTLDKGEGDDHETSACAKGFADCNGDASDGCEARLSEPAHCGGCTTACGASSPLCVSEQDGHFSCASGCPREASGLCGYQCVDPKTNAAHCGECGRICPGAQHGEGVCRDGDCRLQCAAGYHACAMKCFAVSDPTACGDACKPCVAGAHSTATCDKGACGIACIPSFGNCDGDVRNGCETSLLEDAKHCGGCGKPCAPSTRCVGGICLPLGARSAEE